MNDADLTHRPLGLLLARAARGEYDRNALWDTYDDRLWERSTDEDRKRTAERVLRCKERRA